MHITRNSRPTAAGPAQWFTGNVYIDPIASPSGSSRLNASNVRFTPGARTTWHRHPNGQTIYVTDGGGRVGRRNGPVEEIRPGDAVFFDPQEDHWHGAAPDRFMSHVSMVEVDEAGNSASWGEQVTDDEYGGR